MSGIVVDQPFSGIGDIILYAGGLYIIYNILKSGNIISAGLNNTTINTIKWEPLTNTQLNSIYSQLM